MRSFVIAMLLVALAVPARAADKSDRERLDEVIDRALAFLSDTQSADGTWGSNGGRRPQRGGGNAALTALGVMAFLSAGHIPGEGKYGEQVEKGIRAVMSMQRANGIIASAGGHEMYHHGICTLMLAEVVGMTEGKLAETIRTRLEKAVALTLRAQRKTGDHRGGWRYSVDGSDSDISVTGWQVMSLRAAKNVGCDVPPEAIDKAIEFIKRCYDPSTGGYRYMPFGHLTIPCTGTSILALELCGTKLHRTPENLKAGALILKQPPHFGQGHFFYGIYYTSQAMFQLGDNYWKSYRQMLHTALFKEQAANGSWGARGDDGFGPNYATSMAVLALTVEYRFLPIYQRGEESNEKE